MGWVNDRYKHGYKETQPLVRQYWLNDSFVEGDQWIWFNAGLNRPEAVDTEDRIQATMNRIRLNIRSTMSAMMQRPLVFNALPSLADDASMEAARLAETICYDLHKQHNWRELRKEWLLATLKGGVAGLCVDWDDTTQESNETVLPVAEFVLEPGSRSVERARWWVKSQMLPPAVVQGMFDLPRRPPARQPEFLDSVSRRAVGVTKLTQVLTYYERPNPTTPDGWFAVEVDGKIVQDGEWPFPFRDRLNLVLMRETAIEGHWYGSTYLTDARKVQVAYNAAWSNFLEHMKEVGAAKVMVRSSMMDSMTRLSDVPGEFIEVPDGIDPPAYLEVPNLASWLFKVAEDLRVELDDIMSRHDVSRGDAPPNIESGVGLSILSDNDGGPAEEMLTSLATGFEQVCGMILALSEKHVTKKRTSVVDSGYGPERIEWVGKDILGQTDVIVPHNEILPKSRAAMLQFAQKAMEMGLIKDIVQFVRLSDAPNQAGMLAAVSPATAKARRMIHELVTGDMKQPPLPEKFDDSEMMIRMLNEFRMSVRYEQLTKDRRANVDRFVQAHENLLAEKMARRSAQAQVSPALAQQATADNAPPIDAAAELQNQQAPGSAGPGPSGPTGPEGPAGPPSPSDAGKIADQMLSNIVGV